MDFFKEKTNKNIEALKFIQKQTTTDKNWVNCGSLFIQMPNKNISESLKKDQKILFEDMKDLEKEMENKKKTISNFNQK